MIRKSALIFTMLVCIGCSQQGVPLRPTVPSVPTVATAVAPSATGATSSEASAEAPKLRGDLPNAPTSAPRPSTFTTCNGVGDARCYERISRALMLDMVPFVNAENSNLVISPYGIATATTMLYLGTSGSTKAEIEHVTHLDSMPKPRLLKAAKQAAQAWQRSRRLVELGIEQEIITASDANLRQSWLDSIQGTWSAKRSSGLTPPDQVAIVSRVNFKGKWVTAFDHSWTRDAEFFGKGGTKSTVRMMRQEHSFPYLALPELKVTLLAIPYRGGELELVVVLPTEVDGLWELEHKLTPDVLDRFDPKVSAEVDLYLPRFQLNSDVDLVAPLAALGATRVSQLGAEFDELFMASGDMRKVPAGRQVAFMEVTEEGTVATAVTRYIVADFADGHASEKPIRFEVNHPFLVLIRHKRNKSILFLGRVVEPNYTPSERDAKPPDGTAPGRQ